MAVKQDIEDACFQDKNDDDPEGYPEEGAEISWRNTTRED